MFQLLTQVLLDSLVWKSVRWFSVYKKKNRFDGPVYKSRFDDPVYKENVRKLIGRNRRFEDAKE